MASNAHRRLIRFWPYRDQSPKFRGLYNLKPNRETTGSIGGKPRTLALVVTAKPTDAELDMLRKAISAPILPMRRVVLDPVPYPHAEKIAAWYEKFTGEKI